MNKNNRVKKNNGSVFLLGLYFADFLEKLLALDSKQDELLYRICKLNLCMCQAHTLCKTLGRKNDLVRYFVTYGFSFIEKKNPNSTVLLSYLVLEPSPSLPGTEALTRPEIYSGMERWLSPFLNIQKIIANQR